MSPSLHLLRPAPGPWPLAFPSDRGRLAGWWHPPAGPEEQQLAVVLCRPLGWEAEATYLTFVRWGEALSRAGFPVLRFDYAGTGDSPGSDEEPGRVAAWLASVHAAVDEARRISGRDRVALLGVHLGATLAAIAAAQRSDVEALVCWGAFSTGRAYVRQVRAYRLLNALPSDPRGPAAGGDEEAAGYRLSQSTVAELEQLDLRTLPRAPGHRILLLWRDGQSDPGLVRAWNALRTDLTIRDGAGWTEMMQQPRKALVPTSVLEDSCQFLSRVAGALPRSAPSPAHPEQWERSWQANHRVVEEAVCLGEGASMAGVLSCPVSAPAQPLPTVLFLTTASHHRIGPNRLWVRLARSLSELGMHTLRFDLTGVGDSLLLPGESPTHAYSRESVSEVREVMDEVERTLGARRFILVGLCSGAYLTYHSAIDDPRVDGIVAINPQTFTWKEGDSLELRQTLKSTRYYRKALLRRETWARAIKGELHLRSVTGVLLSRSWDRLRDRAKDRFRRDAPQVAQGLRELIQRGTDVFFLFGADDEGVDALERQAGPALRELKRSPRFQVEIVEGPSHTFEQLWAQELLAERVVGRLSRRFGLGNVHRSAG